MSITPLTNHYAFTNPPSVYDEESLTALEMCGRLGHKVNEIITHVNGWNMPIISEVTPTGDETGELDRAVIQGKLDAGYAVQLAAGTYYLNGPLRFQAGYALKGESQTETVIRCKAGFIDHDPAVSVDHITVRDVTITGPGSGTGIDISRKVAGIETGGRYSNFSNVSIAEYETCVKLSGAWCVNFNHCRFDTLNTCVVQQGSCNNVSYEHCMFLGPTSSSNAVGLKINAEGGAENYGIYIDRCDFERLKQGINAYCCIDLTVSSLYAESVGTVFQLDSCPGFLCLGGYVAYSSRICNTTRSNTAAVYSKCNGRMTDLFVKVNSAETWYALSTASAAPINCERITCVNDGAGECMVNAAQATSISNGSEYHPAGRFVATDVALTATKNFVSYNEPQLAPIEKGQHYKITRFRVKLKSDVTPTKNTTLRVAVNGKGIYEAYLNEGQTYAANSWITLSFVGESYRDAIISQNDIWSNTTIAPTVSGYASGVTGDISFDYCYGTFIL